MRRGVVQAGAAYLVFSWLLIQVADIVTPTLNLPIWVPTLVTFAAICGFPIVLVLAWVLEQRDGRWFLDRGKQSGKMLSGLERNYLSILVAYGVAATGALAYQLTVGFEVPGGPEATVAEQDALLPVHPNSIAVLKFLNIGDNETGEIFSQGLGEDILDRLARIPGLAVSSRGDSWSLPQNASSDLVRRRLRVAYFLEGSVRVIGDELKVVVQLIESATGFHMFSRSFETQLDNYVDVQREITDLAVANMRAALPEGVGTAMAIAEENTDVDAYVLFRRGKAILDKPRTVETRDRAIDYFRQALDIDPGFSAAYAGICEAYAAHYQFYQETNVIGLAETACSNALRANPNLDIVYTSLGRLYSVKDNDLAAESAYRQALEINPNNVLAMYGLAGIFERNQQFDKAETMLRLAIDIQPGNWRNLDSLGGFYFDSGRYEEAAHAYRQVVYLDPNNWQDLGNLGSALMMLGDFSGALDALRSSVKINEEAMYLSNMGIVYYYLGEYDRAVEVHRRARDKLPSANFVWLNLGDALTFSSNPEDALRAYQQAIKVGEELLATDANNVSNLYMQAWALASTGKVLEARVLLDKALDISPADPYVWYYDGLLRSDAGDRMAAIASFQKAIDRGFPAAMLAADPLLGELHGDATFEAAIEEGPRIPVN
jgi:tetratricopeptide (TPR) repeat protein/TolB-like protein